MLARIAGWPTLLFALLWARPTFVEAGSPFHTTPTARPLWGRLFPFFLAFLILLACGLHELRKKRR